MNKATTWDLKCLLDGVIVQGNKYSLFTSLDSDGEEEVPQQLSVNSSAVSSYDQSNQDQDVVQEIPSEDLYYPNHGQTNGYFFLSFFLFFNAELHKAAVTPDCKASVFTHQSGLFCGLLWKKIK